VRVKAAAALQTAPGHPMISLSLQEGMSKPEFSRGKSKTFQPFNRAFSALYNALQLHSECAELKRD